MKVLMVNKFLYPNGGSETYIFKIGEYLQSIGHEVQYFGMEHEGRIVGNHADVYTDNMDFHGKSSLGSKLSKAVYPFKILYSFEAKKKMLQVLQDFQPDVVHFNNINFQLTPSVIDAVMTYRKQSGTEVKMLYTAHDYQWVCPNHMMRRADVQNPEKFVNCEACLGGHFKNCTKYRCIHQSKLRSILGTMEARLYQKKKTYSLMDHIICPSDFMKSKIDSNKELAGKTVMLRNFIDKEDQGDTISCKAQAIRNHSEAEAYVLYLGRFSEEKGMKTLLEVCKKCADIQFKFAGNGPLEDEVNKVSNVENLGFVKGATLKALIQNARFSIYPSEWYENGPFSVMESIQAGTPVIGARIGGIPELIQNQKTGLLFTSKSVDELEQAVRTLWTDHEKNAQYVENCGEVQFDTVETYCKKLLNYYTK